MASIKYWVWLSAQTGVSSAAKAALLRHYGDAEAAFFAPHGEFGRIKGLSAGDAAILESRDRTLAGPTVPPGGLYLTRLWYEDERLNG